MTPLRTRLRRLAVPNVLANLTVPLAGLVDTAVLGHLPEAHHLAGVALASILFDLIWGVVGFLRMGTTGLVAQARGEGRPRRAEEVLARSALLGLLLGLLLLLLQAPLGELAFQLLAGSAEVQSSGRDYYGARILAAPMATLGFALLGGLLGQGRGRAVLAVAFLTHVSNILLDLLLVYGLGWGAYGAGVATACAQTLGTLLALFLVLRRWQGGLPSLRQLTEPEALLGLLALSRDILIRTLCLTGSFALFTQLNATLGTITLASSAVLLKLLSLGSWFIDGVAFAAETLAGEAHGRGDRSGLKELLGLSLRWGVGLGLLIALLVLLLPGPILGLLTDHPEILEASQQMAPWLLPALGIGGAAYILDGVYLGLAAGPALRRAMIWSASLGFLPAALLAWRAESAHGLWAAMTLFMAARVITLSRSLPELLPRPESLASGGLEEAGSRSLE